METSKERLIDHLDAVVDALRLRPVSVTAYQMRQAADEIQRCWKEHDEDVRRMERAAEALEAKNAEIRHLGLLLQLETAALEQSCAAPINAPITVEAARSEPHRQFRTCVELWFKNWRDAVESESARTELESLISAFVPETGLKHEG